MSTRAPGFTRPAIGKMGSRPSWARRGDRTTEGRVVESVGCSPAASSAPARSSRWYGGGAGCVVALVALGGGGAHHRASSDVRAPRWLTDRGLLEKRARRDTITVAEMPFTLAHVVAAVPLRRALGRRAVVSALVIGTMVPDFRYFVPGIYDIETHTPRAPSGLAPLGLATSSSTRLAEAAALELLPPWVRRRVGAPRRVRGLVALVRSASSWARCRTWIGPRTTRRRPRPARPREVRPPRPHLTRAPAREHPRRARPARRVVLALVVGAARQDPVNPVDPAGAGVSPVARWAPSASSPACLCSPPPLASGSWCGTGGRCGSRWGSRFARARSLRRGRPTLRDRVARRAGPAPGAGNLACELSDWAVSARRIGIFYAVAFVATHAVTTAYRLHGGSWNTLDTFVARTGSC